MPLKMLHIDFCERFSDQCDGVGCKTCEKIFNGIIAAEEKFNSAAQSGPANKTQAEILLLRVSQHVDEIKFGCLHGLRADLKRYAAKLSAVR